MKTVNFCFATHNHQPIGNFDNIIEEAYQRSYLPFFEHAEKYPIRFATHFTGILLDWIEKNHPEYILRLRQLVATGKLEMISGGFYEPILSVIPPRDQLAQIAKLSNRIRDKFQYEPSGMWLAERVWEQPLAASLHDAGIRYVLLDDTHFLAAGLAESELNGYYLTEDQGKTLAVFPIAKALRYTIPFANVDETIQVLKDAASEDGKNIVCFADDGEKFGVWPRTYDHVYKDGWLVEFFRKLSENSEWLKMKHLAEVIDEIPPIGRVYLPTASYAEMMQWALPTARANQSYEDFVHKLEADKTEWEEYMPFVRGGYWRNFFAKYPETNQLHKHMLRTSNRLNIAAESGFDVSVAYDSLLAAQCNDPYWHGVFGGAYLTNLRHANFSALVKADALLDEVNKNANVQVSVGDFDCDGQEDVILESTTFSLFIKPSIGGMIAELDYKPGHFNAMNSISRKEEAYHKKITKAADAAESGSTSSKSIHDMVETKESGLEKLLAYDWYRHGCMIDHFFDAETTAEEMKTMKFEECGDFVTSPYLWGWKKDGILELECSGLIKHDGKKHGVRLKKSISMQMTGGTLNVTYEVTNESANTLRLRLGSEWLFNLLAGSAHDRYFMANGERLQAPDMNSIGALDGVGNIRLVDEYLKLSIEINALQASSIWRLPLESVSLSEGGFERVYQGSIVMPIWDIEIQPGQLWQTDYSVVFNTIG